MPAVLVRDLSVETHRALKRRAKAHGSSTAAEIRSILEEAVRPEKPIGLGTRLAKIGRKYGGFDLEIKRDPAPLEPANFD